MILKKMLFHVVFCLSLSLCVVTANAQNNSAIQLNLNNATLSEAIKSIELQSDYRFVFDNSVPLQQRVTLQSSEENIATILTSLFSDKNISYEISGNQVVLKREVQQAAPRRNIEGNIADAAGEPVIGATVMVKGDATKGTVTDYDGNYSLIDVPQDAVISISYVGLQHLVVHQ